MAKIETWLRQDLKKPVKVQYLAGNLFSQDNQGNLIGVEVYNGSNPANVNGNVTANVVRADGATVAVTNGTISGNKCSVVLPGSAYAIPGQISIVIKLTNGNEITTIGAIVSVVYRSSTDTAVDPGTILPSIQSLINQINNAVASIPQNNDWHTIDQIITDEYVDEDGNFAPYTGWDRSGYLYCRNSTYILIQAPRGGRRVSFYNGNKQFISAYYMDATITTPDVYMIQVPDTACYFVVYETHALLPQYKYELISGGNSWLTIGSIVQNQYVTNQGAIENYDGWDRSDYIYCKNAQLVKVRAPRGGRWLSFYAKDKTFVSNYLLGEPDVTYPTTYVVPVPIKAYYFILYERNDYLPLYVYDILQNRYWEEITPVFDNNIIKPNAKVKGINRLGIKTSAPEQSIPAYREAVKAGFEILLCDLRFTADDVPVCLHDETINRVACIRGPGSAQDNEIPASVDSRIQNYRYSDLSGYDFGLKAGEQYRNLDILSLEQFLSFCKAVGVQIYIEIKYGTKEQIQSAVKLVEKYGMIDSVSWTGWHDNNHLQYVVEANRTCRVGLMPHSNAGIGGIPAFKPYALALKTGYNEVFSFGWNDEPVTANDIAWCAENHIGFEIGTIDTKQGIIDYMNAANHYVCTGIESNLYNAPDVLLENAGITEQRYVRVDEQQNLTNAQKLQALTNIGAVTISTVVNTGDDYKIVVG